MLTADIKYKLCLLSITANILLHHCYMGNVHLASNLHSFDHFVFFMIRVCGILI